MGSVEWKCAGMLESGNGGEGPRLPMTGITRRPEITLMHVLMTAVASTAEPDEAFLTLWQWVGYGERMARFAGDFEMLAGQVKIESRMIEALWVVNPGQGKTLLIDHLEIAAVMLGMALAAVSGQIGRNQTVESRCQ